MREVIDFKSISEYLYDEKKGLKNHTEREIDLNDERFQKLFRAWKKGDFPFIRINLVDLVRCETDKAKSTEKDEMYSFVREIQHIAIWKNLMIITWKHVDMEKDNG